MSTTPEGSLFTANAALVAQAHAQLEATSGVASAFNGQRGSPTGAGAGHPVTPIAFGMRPGFTQFSYLQQICRAMTYLHTLTPCPVLFRNLKSPNLMLDKNRTRILLTDLAISRPLSQHANLTPAQGSDRWLAPEVQAGNDYDLRADVFSFGMVCWEVVTCELPFVSYSTRQTALLISKGYRPLLPPHTAEWAMKLMSICNAHVPEARATFPDLFAVFEQARDPTQLSASLDDMLNHAVQVMSQAGMILPAQDPRNGIMPSPTMQQQQPQTVQPQAMQPQAMQPQAMQPQAMQPQAMQPQAMQPQAMQPQAMQPQAMQPQMMHPQAMHPQTVQQSAQGMHTPRGDRQPYVCRQRASDCCANAARLGGEPTHGGAAGGNAHDGDATGDAASDCAADGAGFPAWASDGLKHPHRPRYRLRTNWESIWYWHH